jgi:asparaginyl-tRNA synthetase
MIEPEVCFVKLPQLIELACRYVITCLRDTLKDCFEEIKITHEAAITFNPKFSGQGKEMFEERRKRLEQLKGYTEKPVAVITYTQAFDELMKAVYEGRTSFEEPVSWGIDMSSEHEKFLTNVVYQSPVVVHSYPANIKAFYMKRYTISDVEQIDSADERCVQSFDLLVPGIGELIGGSIREHDGERLSNVMTAKGMDLVAYQQYLDLRVFGTVPHGGFGLGFERLVQFVTGLSHIQDCIPFPRAF